MIPKFCPKTSKWERLLWIFPSSLKIPKFFREIDQIERTLVDRLNPLIWTFLINEKSLVKGKNYYTNKLFIPQKVHLKIVLFRNRIKRKSSNSNIFCSRFHYKFSRTKFLARRSFLETVDSVLPVENPSTAQGGSSVRADPFGRRFHCVISLKLNLRNIDVTEAGSSGTKTR